MHIEQEKKAGCTVFHIQGRLDGLTALDLEQTFQDSFNSQADGYIFNLKALSYISSAGLRAILFCSKKARAEGISFRICELVPTVREVFAIAGFARFMDIDLSLVDVLPPQSE